MHPLASYDLIQIGNTLIRIVIQDAKRISRGEKTLPAAPVNDPKKTLVLAAAARELSVEAPKPAPPFEYSPRTRKQPTHLPAIALAATVAVVLGATTLRVAKFFSRPVIIVEKTKKLPLPDSVLREKPVTKKKPQVDTITQLLTQQLGKARDTEKQDDVKLYLRAGEQSLKDGDFDEAAESFHSALVLDPESKIAAQGLKATEGKQTTPDRAPVKKLFTQEKHQMVSVLMDEASNALADGRLQRAIDSAEKVRSIELKGETRYLNLAKQIIDQARARQKELFEPFLQQARQLFADGDYNGSRNLCEEMLKRDRTYAQAQLCVSKARDQLNYLAQEAFEKAYILESMNRIDEAGALWKRALIFVHPGDTYYDRIVQKLSRYHLLTVNASF